MDPVSQDVHYLTKLLVFLSSRRDSRSPNPSTCAAPIMRILDAPYLENDSGRTCAPCDDDATRKPSPQARPAARWGDVDGAVYHKRRKASPGPGNRLECTTTLSDKGITTTAPHARRTSQAGTSRRLRSLLCLSLLSQPAAAVLLNKFDNCLPESTKDSDPLELQWIPLYVGATFDTKNKSHNLRVTVWGNVTGAYNPTAGPELPPWDSDDWSNPNVTDGKIVDNPFPTSANFLTTLHSKIDVVTYEPYAADFDFCKDALTNASCPLGPVFNRSEMYVSVMVPVIFVLQAPSGVGDDGRCGAERCSPLCVRGTTAGSCLGLSRSRLRLDDMERRCTLVMGCSHPIVKAR